MSAIAIKIIIVAVIIGVAATVGLMRISKMDKAERKEKVMAWLLQAVIVAEKSFGSGTGRLKLSSVYAEFVRALPSMAEIITFETFSYWVDEALSEMRELLMKNKQIAEIVEGGQNE